MAANGDGHHNPDTDCLTCHGSGAAGAPIFTVAGTLHSSPQNTPLGGASIVVVDAAGQQIQLVSGTNGNFYTAMALTLPLRVRASKCPSDVAMGQAATSGSCNSCHQTGNPINLPAN